MTATEKMRRTLDLAREAMGAGECPIAAIVFLEDSDDFAAYRLPQITGGLLREESKALFKEFAEKCPPGGLKDFALSLARL